MKKTGKVLSLVLSLALVASSLTATFASAASKSGTATLNVTDTVYLSNGDSSKLLDLNEAEIDGVKLLSLDSIAVGSTDLKATDVSDFEVTDVSSSNSSVAAVKKYTVGSETHYFLKLASSTAAGSFTLSVRYKNDDVEFDGETATTVYATGTIPFTVLDEGDAYVLAAGGSAHGVIPDSLASMNKTADVEEGSVYTVAAETSSLLAVFTPKDVTTDKRVNGFYITSSDDDNLAVTTSNDGGDTDTTTTFKLATTPAVGKYAATKTYKVTAQNYASGAAVSSSSENKATASVKIDNTVTQNPNFSVISSYKNVTYLYSKVIDDADTYKEARPTTLTENSAQIVTSCNIDLTTDVTMDSGTVGTVNDPYTTVSALKFTVNGGTVTESDVAKTVVTDGTVKTIDGTTVDVSGGTIGTVTGTTINVESSAEVKAVIGDTTVNASGSLTVDSVDSYAAKVGTVTAGGDCAITIMGDAATCGQIDAADYNVTVNFDGFTGTVAAPKNAYFEDLYGDTTGITLKSTDSSDVTVTGDAVVPAMDVETGTISFPGSLNVGSTGISGSGTVCVVPGKLFSNGPIDNVSLKLIGSAKVGDTIFTATTDEVDENYFTTVGYTLEKTAGTKVDTFKVTAVTFAGLEISGPKTITQKTTASYVANAYPNGTALPTGYSVEWSIDADDTVFTAKADGNKITVTAGAYNDTFASVNKATLTATVLDENGDASADYDAATYDIEIIKAPQYVSDTTGTYNMTVGQTYQFKITSSDGSVPPFVVANGGATVAPYTKSGNDYFFKVTGAKAGDYGVYVGGKVCVLHITNGVICDTTTVTIASGKTYQFKVTAPSEPEFVVATVGKVALDHKVGNDYFYKVMNDGAEGQYGVYINGVRMAIITCTK